MAAKGKAVLIISKTRTKDAVTKCHVADDVYRALDRKVREMLTAAESRALANKRKTIRPQDL